ncbi:MAG: AAA family ATPase [Roseofilum sp. SID2]|nr:AAA family ATPase [Roseofilum sp. SID3]MBP0025251.1 AAA family ATPase [Roseofilum sp. SID2]MBP0037875.1 AAA family ATPase [Roseofilum sp. SID1]
MYLKTVFIRFYKSFNDDFLRKNDERVKPKPWEQVDETFYPYIEVPIEEKITTIVGANESGKSHLLSALEKAITGKEIERSDFCRYSPFFTVKQNELKYPDFGTEWTGFTDDQKTKLRRIIAGLENVSFDRIFVFRENSNKTTVYLREQGEYKTYKVDKDQALKLQEILPEILKIESDVALPSNVPIKKLVELGDQGYSQGRKFEILDQNQRNKIVDALDIFNKNPGLIKEVQNILGPNVEKVDGQGLEALKTIVSALDEVNYSEAEKEKREKQFALAYKLICKIAQVDTNALIDLTEAIKNGMQGYANGIIEKINRQLAINLNFPNYWVQDRNFCLKVIARDYDLVFTITDRTGTEYSFDERSQGLRYFLSYFIQYRSHESHSEKSEILLMDEPDAYLSSQAQQDLLKIFDLFSSPDANSHLKHPIQVIYVTHSPFLIDKNHGERIRVLQKGNEDEGTRVVKDAARNHYEPLRSSIGPYVGETTFIGNCNLMVEGLSDQILIAGATTYLRSRDISNLETLDLNQITIVPSGSASHIPYQVYLARGRDVEQPAVIVLLDSDSSGDDAKKHLLGKRGQHRKPLLKEEFILQLGDLRDKFVLEAENISMRLEIEDIIPLPICIAATKHYLREFLQINELEIDRLSEDVVRDKLASTTILDALQESFTQSSQNDLKINKVGCARNVIKVVNEWAQAKEVSETQSNALTTFEKNFRYLFKKLNEMQRYAQQKLTDEKLTQKIERLKKDFNARYPISAKREDAVILLDEIERILYINKENESSKEIEAIGIVIQNLRRHFKLDIEMNKSIDDYSGFQSGLERIKYAGLLASQDKEISHDSVLNEGLEEIPNKSQADDTSINKKDDTNENESLVKDRSSLDKSGKTNSQKKTRPR